MNEPFVWLVVIALGCFVVASWRTLRGPTVFDRYLTVGLFGTLATAASIGIAGVADSGAALDVAIVFVLLGSVAAVAVTRTGGDST